MTRCRNGSCGHEATVRAYVVNVGWRTLDATCRDRLAALGMLEQRAAWLERLDTTSDRTGWIRPGVRSAA